MIKLNELGTVLVCLTNSNCGKVTGYRATATLNYLFNRWSHQQIYRTLNQLEKVGTLECKVKFNDGKPDSKVYDIKQSTFDSLDLNENILSPDIAIFLNCKNRIVQLIEIYERDIQHIESAIAEEDDLHVFGPQTQFKLTELRQTLDNLKTNGLEPLEKSNKKQWHFDEKFFKLGR